jgi:hypothetical protein
MAKSGMSNMYMAKKGKGKGMDMPPNDKSSKKMDMKPVKKAEKKPSKKSTW